MSTAAAAAIESARPRLIFFHDERSGRSRRAEGFLAQVLQRGRNHQTFVIHRVEVGQRPDLADRFKIGVTPTLLVVAGKKVQARLESPTGCRDIEMLLGYGSRPLRVIGAMRSAERDPLHRVVANDDACPLDPDDRLPGDH